MSDIKQLSHEPWPPKHDPANPYRYLLHPVFLAASVRHFLDKPLAPSLPFREWVRKKPARSEPWPTTEDIIQSWGDRPPIPPEPIP